MASQSFGYTGIMFDKLHTLVHQRLRVFDVEKVQYKYSNTLIKKDILGEIPYVNQVK